MSKNMLRNPVDYILTDCLPNELSIRYTHSHFYNYIIKNKSIMKEIEKQRNINRKCYIKGNLLFEGLSSVPLKYSVAKSDGQYRTISIMNPLGALNAFFFIDLYENNILSNLGKSKYSIRKSEKNNNLYHRHTNNGLTTYTSGKKRAIVLEQRGDYFNVGPYNSLIDFQRSTEWFSNGLKYSYLALFDFAKCFDSIYSHSYKWFMTNNLEESKKFNNSHLFKSLDTICQNINGKQTNGIIVGAEFSRMIAELLLQQIDELIYHELDNMGIEYSNDYLLYRYVDDFYLFATNEELINKIISVVQMKSQQFNLTLNNNKSKIYKLPSEQNLWFSEIDVFKNKLLELFELDEFGKNIHIKKPLNNRISHLKTHFLNLISKNNDKKQKITRYALTIIDNKFLEAQKKPDILENFPNNRIFEYIDFVFYLHQFDLSFNSTSKLISILNRIDEIEPMINSSGIQGIVNKYFETLELYDYSDIQNLILVLAQLNIQFPIEFEKKMCEDIMKSENPILIAHLYLYYSKSSLESAMADSVNEKIRVSLDRIIIKKSALLYKEFWYILIFYNFPRLDSANKSRIKEITRQSLKNVKNDHEPVYNILGRFILENRMGFFQWDDINELESVSFKTENLSIFKNSY